MHTQPPGRLVLPVPDATDPESAFPLVSAAQMAILDNAVTYSQGTIGSLPAAGLAGRRYYATDAGVELYDTGTQWISTGTPTPIGAMTNYAGSGDPMDLDGTTRWLVCDGRAISRTTYATLFGVVSTTYGTGNGSTTFNIPDARSRGAVGAGQGSGLSNRTLASTGGEENHLLTTSETPAHLIDVDQSITSYVGIEYSGGAGRVSADLGTVNTGNAGSVSAHNNMQPWLALNYIIKVR